MTPRQGASTSGRAWIRWTDRSVRLVPEALALIAVLLPYAISGCGDEIVTRTESGGVGGRIVGRVVGPHGPIRTRLMLRTFERGYLDDPRTTIETQSDANGHFTLDAPARDYALGFTSDSGVEDDPLNGFLVYWRHDRLTTSLREADTLHIEREATLDSINLELGGLQVELDLASELMGDRLYVEAYRQHSNRYDLDDLRTARIVSPDTTHVGLTFDQLPPGLYRVRVTDYDLPPEGQLDPISIWLPDAFDALGADTVRVRGRSLTLVNGRFMPELYRVEGVVDGAWLGVNPTHPPLIAAWTSDSVRVAYCRARQDGGFAIAVPRRMPLRVAVHGSYNDAWFEVPGGRGETLFTPPPSGPLTGLRFTDAAIAVRWDPAYLGEGDIMGLKLVDDRGGTVSRETMFHSEPVSLGFLRPGRYRLLVEPEFLQSAYLPVWFDGADSLEAATVIEIRSEGEIQNVIVRPRLGATIRGRISDADGVATSDVRVFLMRAETPEWVATVEVEGGNFVARGLATGTYRVGADWATHPWRGTGHEDEVAVWYPDAHRWSDAEMITVTAPDTISNIDLVLPWPGENRPATPGRGTKARGATLSPQP